MEIMFSFSESMAETLFLISRVCHLKKFPPIFYEVEKKVDGKLWNAQITGFETLKNLKNSQFAFYDLHAISVSVSDVIQ